MSVAGIRSNRGDKYQTLVAFGWVLTILSDPNYQWIEIDSASYPVDDVVIAKTDGSLICCQCKKNQTDFKAWTITDLSDEIIKAAKLLDTNKNAAVRFYSRSPFGALAKLREYSITQPDEVTYRRNLGKEQQKIDKALAAQITQTSPNISTYDFLYRTSFETNEELDRMEDYLHERLRVLVCNPRIVYDVLWTRLDKLGARMGGDGSLANIQHRLTKDDIKDILHEAGSMLVPIMDLVEVRKTFSSTSAIGRMWHRDIADRRISNPILGELISSIENKNSSILLTGQPGSGKTCVMLELQEALEQRAQSGNDILPLFIQAREYADFTTAKERYDQGLPEQWVEKAARMAEDLQVVVVIDSLDVLSIAREHNVLTYFLAQIDRLLLVPNITVVTACRDFDRHYDIRIAERQWDCELKCQPLDWESETAPLLESLSINTSTIDPETRKLISNPRELALFVELAQREGSFSVITSQALAQRYLDTLIRANDALGEIAMHAIEGIATEMLHYRSLTVPQQRFNASQDILRLLCSLNVLRITQGGQLTFGHQTLLDVLVISEAIRRGITLNEFIQTIPQVPFVRPSIRSFVGYLATGDRRNFRKQLRTVLTGSAAFHIRRLVAESLAEQRPIDDDWPLIRDLRNNHREVFQVIYNQAKLIEWHYFWLNHLVPILIDEKDVEGLSLHIQQVSIWKNEDTAGVLAFWMEALQLDWLDINHFVMQLPRYLSSVDIEKMDLVAPLLEQIISMPRQEHSLLGHAVARCVASGSMEDIWLWRYIAGEISDDDVVNFRFDKKLHCQLHDFTNLNDNFLIKRMVDSNKLLDLALESIERWSKFKSSHYGNTQRSHQNNFLFATSYEEVHSQNDLNHKDSENILLDSIETAIINHAKSNSEWWKANRERLSFNHESALRYFAILACSMNPEPNIDLIGLILTDKDMLESELSYELGSLIQVSFISLDTATQDAVLNCILSLWDDQLLKEPSSISIFKKRAEFIAAIPRYLRSSKSQSVLDDFEHTNGTIIREPHLRSFSGWVRPPFSYEVFHQISDNGILKLLEHYSGYKRDFYEHLIGGEQQVSSQLSEASSRHPSRFLRLLLTGWTDISEGFRDAIMGGVSEYLAHRFGGLQTNDKWKPLEEPDSTSLAINIIDELERHSLHWYRNRSASRAIESCSHVIKDTRNAARLVFLTIGYANVREESTIIGDNVDLITAGVNMMCGHVAEALMILATNLQEQSTSYPELLEPTLWRFAANENPTIRALILRRLPYLLKLNPKFGWKLFHLSMQDATGLWQIAEPCLYYSYHNYFDEVVHLLQRIHKEGSDNEMETWGRISALAVLSAHIDFPILVNELKDMEKAEAWRGAASVWTHPQNIKQQPEKCYISYKGFIHRPAVITPCHS
jgi:hypothetical protein